MNVSKVGNHVRVTLSERNVRTMAKALDLKINPDLGRVLEDGTLMDLHVESDEEHYKNASDGRKAGSKEIQNLLEHNKKW